MINVLLFACDHLNCIHMYLTRYVFFFHFRILQAYSRRSYYYSANIGCGALGKSTYVLFENVIEWMLRKMNQSAT